MPQPALSQSTTLSGAALLADSPAELPRDMPALHVESVERRVIERALAKSGLLKAFGAKKLPALKRTRAKLREIIASEGLADSEFGRQLSAFGRRETNFGMMIATGMPEAAPPKLSLALIGELIGAIDHIEAEGDWLIEVAERPNQTPGRPSFANNHAFPLHTDLSYSPAPPAIMLLQSVSNSPEDAGYSVLADFGAATMRLDRSTLEELAKPDFLFPAPTHFKGERHVHAPILTTGAHNRMQHFIRFRRDDLRMESRSALLAVEDLSAALDEVKIEFLLAEGMIAIVDNWRVLHGRTGFLSNPTPTRARVLNRMYVKAVSQ